MVFKIDGLNGELSIDKLIKDLEDQKQMYSFFSANIKDIMVYQRELLISCP